MAKVKPKKFKTQLGYNTPIWIVPSDSEPDYSYVLMIENPKARSLGSHLRKQFEFLVPILQSMGLILEYNDLPPRVRRTGSSPWYLVGGLVLHIPNHYLDIPNGRYTPPPHVVDYLSERFLNQYFMFHLEEPGEMENYLLSLKTIEEEEDTDAGFAEDELEVAY